MKNNNRDFVDFVIDLVANRRIFYLYLVLLLGFATYYDSYKNKEYKLETIIKVAPESVLIPIIDNLNIYNTSEDVYLGNPLQTNVSYNQFAIDLCGIVRSTFIDLEFHKSITRDYINKTPDILNRDEVLEEFKNALTGKNPAHESNCLKIEANSNVEIITYLRNYYGSMVNMYIRDEISQRLKNTRDGKIDFLSKSLESSKQGIVDKTREDILNQLELNALEERSLVVLSKLALLQKTPIVNTDINYFMYRVSNIQKKLGTIFIYAFAIFMTFIFHVMTIVLIDFRKQYLIRRD
jgi:hypothetical protein